MATRWIDNETFLLDDAIKRIMEKDNKEDYLGEDENEDADGGTKYCNWEVNKIFDKNIESIFNNRDIKFNYIHYKYDKIRPGINPIRDRTTHKNGIVVLYSDDENINYIISRNSDAMKTLRLLLGYSGRGEISENDHEIDEGMFIWLISKVYNSDNKLEIEDGEKDLKIGAIKGFRGDSNDLLTKVTAHGDSVMNIISTLSFLLESNKLSQVTLNASFSEHASIELTMNVNNSLSIDKKRYMGIYDEDNRYLSEAKLYLLIYLELMPQIIQSYQGDIEDGHWNREKNVSFLRSVAEDLSEQVQGKLERLENDRK